MPGLMNGCSNGAASGSVSNSVHACCSAVRNTSGRNGFWLPRRMSRSSRKARRTFSVCNWSEYKVSNGLLTPPSATLLSISSYGTSDKGCSVSRVLPLAVGASSAISRRSAFSSVLLAKCRKAKLRLRSWLPALMRSCIARVSPSVASISAPASLVASSRYWSPACLVAMPINSSSKACRGDTGFFGAALVVGVATMVGPAQAIQSGYHILAHYFHMAIQEWKDCAIFCVFS